MYAKRNLIFLCLVLHLDIQGLSDCIAQNRFGLLGLIFVTKIRAQSMCSQLLYILSAFLLPVGGTRKEIYM